MKRGITNLAASIRDRLRNLAVEKKIDYGRMLLLYFQERLLYRLSISTSKNRFLLKGGLLLYSAFPENARPTRDVDLSAFRVRREVSSMRSLFSRILALPSIEDGLRFNLVNLEVEGGGLRVSVTAGLEQARQRLRIDIGFGDVVFAEANKLEYPTLLGTKPFLVSAYPLESVIAEKLQIIASLKEVTSRMKDFYDLYFLMNRKGFSGPELARAISGTFARRHTEIEEMEYILGDAFMRNEAKAIQWRAFLGKSKIETQVDYAQVMAALKGFLGPVVSAILADKPFDRSWKPGGRWR